MSFRCVILKQSKLLNVFKCPEINHCVSKKYRSLHIFEHVLQAQSSFTSAKSREKKCQNNEKFKNFCKFAQCLTETSIKVHKPAKSFQKKILIRNLIFPAGIFHFRNNFWHFLIGSMKPRKSLESLQIILLLHQFIIPIEQYK